MSLPNDIVPDRDEARRRQAEDPLLGSAATAAEAAGLACPDAELLGLFAERALSRAEAAAIETHVRGCARCEDVVAAITRALPVEGASDAAGATAGAGVAGWLRGWRWLVPVMSLAGAAAVAFWLGRSPVPVAEMDMARTEAGPAGAASPGTPRADADKDAFSKQAPPPAVPVAQAPSPAAAAPGASASAGGPALADRVGRVGPAAPNAAPLEAANSAKAVGATGAAGASATAAEEATSAKSMAESLEARREIAAPAETMAAPAAPAAAPAPPPARLAARERAAEPKTTGNVAADAASPAPASETAASQSAAGAGAAASTVGAADLRAAFPRWRVRDGRVEFARDGKAWRRVTLPTSERVTSVTERPDGTVLVITASGVQFVSANLGATWERQ